MNIIFGAGLITAGAYMVFKANWLLNNFGSIPFFDKYLGTEGGSRLGYKIIGMLVVFIGMLIMTGMIGGFLQWLFAPLLKYANPGR